MGVKKDLSLMSIEEALDYVQKQRKNNNERSKRYYNNTIKNNEEKYNKHLEQCKIATKKYKEKKLAIQV